MSYYRHNKDGWEIEPRAKKIAIPFLSDYQFFYTVDVINKMKYRIS